MTNHARKFYVLLANHVKVYVYDADEVINVFRTGLVSSLLVLRFAPDANMWLIPIFAHPLFYSMVNDKMKQCHDMSHIIDLIICCLIYS